jgi:transcriptional repressor NrdR
MTEFAIRGSSKRGVRFVAVVFAITAGDALRRMNGSKACSKSANGTGLARISVEQRLSEASRRLAGKSHILDNYDREVGSEDIGNLCMQYLRDLDEVAFVRFASVYRSFRDAQDFVKELTPILLPNDPRNPR